MVESLRMSRRERERLVEFGAVSSGKQSLAEAARRLRLSYRQARRAFRRYRQDGDAGLLHRSRGRPSNRRVPQEVRQRGLELYRERLEGFGPTLAAEKLGSWGVSVGVETLRRWLIAESLWQAEGRTVRPRKARPRRKRFGEMLQLDGSFHDWFSRKDGSRDCLMVLIDDATNRRLSSLGEEETTADAMRLLGRWIERYGIPHSLYMDRKSVYATDREPTLDEQLADQTPLTAFGKSCQRLGIELIFARSPQAKGRVERSHAVYQDRLVKEIRLEGWQTLDQVNAQLSDFDEALNARFAVPALEPEDAHRRPAADFDLGAALVWEETRVVRGDWTLSYEKRWLQILGPGSQLPPVKSRVTVQKRLDGSLHLLFRGRELAFEELPEPPRKVLPPARVTRPQPLPHKPAADHPWRRSWSRSASKGSVVAPSSADASAAPAGLAPHPAYGS